MSRPTNHLLISELLAQLPEQHRAFGYIDKIEEGVITGWAVDLSQGNAPASLFIFIDDEPVANIHCSLKRMDLAAAGLPAQNVGFQYDIPPKYFDGKHHRLAIRLSSGTFLEPSPALDVRDGAIWFQLEPPSLIEGVVDGVVQGAICGWALRTDPESNARIGGLDIIVSYEGQEIGRVKANRFRPDVARAANGPPQCGFIFLPPARFRDGGKYELQFHVAPEGKELKNSPFAIEFPSRTITTKIARLQGAVEALSIQLWELKKELRSLLSATPYDLSSQYDVWAREYFRALEKNRVNTLGTIAEDGPLVSIVCPTYRPDFLYFRQAIESVIKQTYQNWELLVVDDHSNQRELSSYIADCCKRDRRIRAVTLKRNLGISGATNEGIKAARGEWIAFFDHDDLLEPCALELMLAAAKQTGAKLLYSDEDKIEDGGYFSDPNLKPDWNYRLLLAQNYVCHLLMVEAKTLEKAGLLRSEYDGAQDHDLVLRLSEILGESEICHVREILYHWRKTPGSTAERIDAKSYAVAAGAAAITDHLQRRGIRARVSPMLGITTYQISWGFSQEPKVRVIIPFRDQIETTRTCLQRLRRMTAWRNLEIVLVDNWSTSPEAAEFCKAAEKLHGVRVLRVEAPFNFSQLNNLACAESDAEFFVFMNNDVFVEQRDWLRKMVDEALADERVGAVGAKLVYPDRSVQHGGVILGVGGVADHAYRGRPAEDPHFMGRGICAQELSAVTAALMLCRAEAFRKVGGFDEVDLAVAYNDVDLCLKLRQAGYRVIYTPAVIAEHHESLSRGDDMGAARLGRFVFEQETMRQRWGPLLDDDPFYNMHFAPEAQAFQELAAASLGHRAVPAIGVHGAPDRSCPVSAGQVLREAAVSPNGNGTAGQRQVSSRVRPIPIPPSAGKPPQRRTRHPPASDR